MIELEISNTMSVKEGVENKLIRMSEELRKELNLSLGEFIIIQNIALQVDKRRFRHQPKESFCN